jgi:hypothetical protein
LASGNQSRYLVYAIGELLLVIVGILVALQLDNWNQERQEQEQIAEYARALVDDLEADIEMIEPIIVQAKRIAAFSEGLNEYVRGRQIQDIRNLDLLYLTSHTRYRPFSWNRAALHQLTNTGSLRQMKNIELVREISEYEVLTRHLDEDYAADVRAGEQAEAAAFEIVDGNYPEREYKTNPFSWRTPYAFPPTELYDVYSDVELPLLTDDIRRVRAMVNSFGPLARLKGRGEQEFPALQERARKLIQLLQAEYPE